MPYYCTVPRCTSMAGKAKNVSFHQFPRDEELAKLWNNILKRGKPYTKYSKVCSLHFRAEDYTITSAGKNKGQWRTLRKDAIPSQNLPSDSPVPYRRQSGQWAPNNIPALEPQLQQLAQAIYVQTMFAMQAAGVTDPLNMSLNGLPQQLKTNSPSDTEDQPTNTPSTTETKNQPDHWNHLDQPDLPTKQDLDPIERRSYQCDDCSKCFKDPDVFILHKRTHKQTDRVKNEKENYDLNKIKPETLKSNPILANLLKNSMENDLYSKNLFDKQFMLNISSMESYLRTVSSDSYEDCDSNDLRDNVESNNLVIDENVA